MIHTALKDVTKKKPEQNTALEAGYRHIDTAEMYGNETEVGEAIARSGLDRGEVFVTSKLSNDAHEPDEARQAFEGTLKALGTEYIDLFLIHWPLPTRYGGDFVQTWRTLEEFYREGRARSIGVSDFQPHHLRRLHGETQIIPAVNQIEVHPYLTQDDVRAVCVKHQIAVEAWSPLGQGGVLGDLVIRSIAERTGKTPAQVVLRWHIQQGDIVFPKSVTPDRIRENIDIFDFELSATDVEDITVLNKNERTGPNLDKFDGRWPDAATPDLGPTVSGGGAGDPAPGPRGRLPGPAGRAVRSLVSCLCQFGVSPRRDACGRGHRAGLGRAGRAASGLAGQAGTGGHRR